MTNLLRRGLGWYARLSIPRDRWADVGTAMRAPGGVKREIVRTLGTQDPKEAKRRLQPALHAIREDIDGALVAAGMRPLTDWTAAWQVQALERREQLRQWRKQVIGTFEVLDGKTEYNVEVEETQADVYLDLGLCEELDELASKKGPQAAAQYAQIVQQEGFTVAEGARQWIEQERGVRRNATILSHERTFERLGGEGSRCTQWYVEVGCPSWLCRSEPLGGPANGHEGPAQKRAGGERTSIQRRRTSQTSPSW